MSVRPSRHEAKESTRSRLLAAARQEFLRDGYANASMDGIATQAGVTKPAIYRHFASKEAIFVALMQGDVTAAALPDDDPSTAPADRMEAFGRSMAQAIFDGVDEASTALWLEYTALCLRRPDLLEAHRAYVQSTIEDARRQVGHSPTVSDDSPLSSAPEAVEALLRIVIDGFVLDRFLVPALDPEVVAGLFRLIGTQVAEEPSG